MSVPDGLKLLRVARLPRRIGSLTRWMGGEPVCASKTLVLSGDMVYSQLDQETHLAIGARAVKAEKLHNVRQSFERNLRYF